MPGYFDLWTVVFSFSIASFAGFVAFESIEHTRYSNRPGFWTFVGGLTLGFGIWSMHFIGMLAWEPPFPLYYAVSYTAASMVAAVAACWLAMYLTVNAREGAPQRNLPSGAIVVGAGICGMHYLGMAALRFDPPVMWSLPAVLASFVIAAVGSLGAMVLLRRSGQKDFSIWRQTGASLAIGLAVCGMHYMGMMAMRLPDHAVCLPQLHGFSGSMLARIGVGNTLVFMACLLVVFSREKVHLLRSANEARLQAKEASIAAERLGAAGKIAASIAHEINNPLEAVMNLLYLVQSGEMGAQEQEYLQMAQSELARIAEITTHTLKFYRQQGGPQQTSLPELFESTVAIFQKRLQSQGIVVTERFDPSTPEIVCRSGEIRQVFANLVSNAIDAMPEGGSLLLSTAPAPEGGARIEVADTGTGIHEEKRALVLEPFFTTKGAAGTGLGLSICVEILQRHGGSMQFRSHTDPGVRGTCFEVYLPGGV